MSDTVARPGSGDTVVLIPGIMGSELVERATGRVLWGGSSIRWYLDAWLTKNGLNSLCLTEAELTGDYSRVVATRPLRFPAFAPFLQGVEPYTLLEKQCTQMTPDSSAVVAFPYDWRLPVAHNASRLGLFLEELLARRSGQKLDRGQAHSSDSNGHKLILVAHSMGGLLVRSLMVSSPDLLPEIRAVVTLGTPFFGSVKAVEVLNSGQGAPVLLPRSKFRKIAVNLPSIYDLLPRNRCVDMGRAAEHLTPSTVASLGGSRELAERAEQDYRRVESTSLPSPTFVVGAHQPTKQAITIQDGVAEAHEYTCRPPAAPGEDMVRLNIAGDGTVSRDCAQLPEFQAVPLAQSHGALSKSAESFVVIDDVFRGHTTGPWLGDVHLGIQVPDVVRVGEPSRVTVTGSSSHRDIMVRAIDLDTRRPVPTSRPIVDEGRVVVGFTPPAPGLYRIECAGGGASPVSEITLAASPELLLPS